MLSKTPVDEVFMHHFEKMSASVVSPQIPAGELPLDPAGVLQTPQCPPLEKILRAPMPPPRSGPSNLAEGSGGALLAPPAGENDLCSY